MIIECINCHKKFEVDSKLIPQGGRSIKCGSCGHIWFFVNKNIQNRNFDNFDNKEINENSNYKKEIDDKSTKSKEIIKFEKKNDGLTFSKFLSYILVFIISFTGLILILETFKDPLSVFIPNLELILFNLFETFKDIILFINDLN